MEKALYIIIAFLYSNVVSASEQVNQARLLSIAQCENTIKQFNKKSLGGDNVHAYIYESEYATSVAFTHGAVGSFGKRDLNYRQLWVCDIKDNQVVYLSQPVTAPVIGSEEYVYELYHQKRKLKKAELEVLYRKSGNQYEFCCQQESDPSNIKKNNPDYPWDKDAGIVN